MMAPVASLYLLLPLLTSLLAFSNEKLYDKLMLHPYSVSRGKRCLHAYYQRIDP